jgi:hypothetical protein
VQALPRAVRQRATASVARLTAPGGTLLVIAALDDGTGEQPGARSSTAGRDRRARPGAASVEADRLDQATRAMADLAAQWDRRLDTIKRLAEAAHAKAKKSEGFNTPVQGG